MQRNWKFDLDSHLVKVSSVVVVVVVVAVAVAVSVATLILLICYILQTNYWTKR